MFLYSVELLLCLLMTLNDFLVRIGEESHYVPLEGKLSWQQCPQVTDTRSQASEALVGSSLLLSVAVCAETMGRG